MMLTKAPTRPVLRYHGGKWKLAPWIIEHFPKHRVYVEPFGGGASVLLRKDRSYAEVYNDQWDLVVNVFAVLRSVRHAKELERRIRLTPYSRAQFNLCSHSAPRKLGDVEAARLTIFRSFAGFGSAATNGRYVTGFRDKTKNSRTTPATDWRNYADLIAGFTCRMQGVIIENRPALDVIAKHDSQHTLFYADPPYPHSTRNMKRGNAAYECEMTDRQHRELAEILHSVKGMVVLSGYPCDLYDKELYPDWKRFERAHLADGARKRVEVLWLNPACEKALSPTLFSGGGGILIVIF